MLRVLRTEVVLDYAHIMLTSAQICQYSVNYYFPLYLVTEGAATQEAVMEVVVTRTYYADIVLIIIFHFI